MTKVGNAISDPDENTIDVVRKATRELARKFDYGYWRDKDKLGEYPWEFVTAFAQGGWLGALIPEEYGGLGLGLAECGVMMQEIAASGAGASGASAVHFYLFPPAPIIRYGSEEMKQEFLPKLARGEILMAFGVTEPTAGVDTSRITTRAEKVDGGWLVNGQKVWITNAQNAHKILLLARTSPRNEEKPLDGMTLFFTDLDRDRITVREIEKLGRSAIDSNELFIDDLEVRDDEVVGEVGQGFRYLIDGLNSERIVVGLEGVGIGQAALELATRYLRRSPELWQGGCRGQVSGRRGRLRCLRPGHVHARWLRLREGVPRGAAVAGGAAAPQRAVLTGDGPQLHLHAGAEATPRLLRQRPPAAARARAARRAGATGPGARAWLHRLTRAMRGARSLSRWCRWPTRDAGDRAPTEARDQQPGAGLPPIE